MSKQIDDFLAASGTVDKTAFEDARTTQGRPENCPVDKGTYHGKLSAAVGQIKSDKPELNGVPFADFFYTVSVGPFTGATCRKRYTFGGRDAERNLKQCVKHCKTLFSSKAKAIEGMSRKQFFTFLAGLVDAACPVCWGVEEMDPSSMKDATEEDKERGPIKYVSPKYATHPDDAPKSDVKLASTPDDDEDEDVEYEYVEEDEDATTEEDAESSASDEDEDDPVGGADDEPEDDYLPRKADKVKVNGGRIEYTIMAVQSTARTVTLARVKDPTKVEVGVGWEKLTPA